MRHVGGSGTVGKAAPAPVILEEEDYPVHHVPGRDSGSSGSSNSGDSSTIYGHNGNGISSSSTINHVKRDLPAVPVTYPNVVGIPSNANKALPLDPIRPARPETDGTVRRNHRADGSYGSDISDELSSELDRAHIASPTLSTMLDSVVIPAISSVSRYFPVLRWFSCLPSAIPSSVYLRG
jgi:hypothetical protein